MIMHLGDKAYIYGYMTYLKREPGQILSLCKASDYGQLKDLLVRLYQKHIEAMHLYHESLPLPKNPVKPILYEWNYFSERPPVSFNLEFSTPNLKKALLQSLQACRLS